MNWAAAGPEVGWGWRWECFVIGGYGVLGIVMAAAALFCTYYIIVGVISELRRRLRRFLHDLINDGAWERTERHLRGLDEEGKRKVESNG